MSGDRVTETEKLLRLMESLQRSVAGLTESLGKVTTIVVRQQAQIDALRVDLIALRRGPH